MKILWLFLLVSTQVFAHEKVVRTRADKLAYGVFNGQRNHQWPFQLLSIGHNMQSYQDYSNSPYWHDGLDIRGQANQQIFAAAGGVVVNIENYVAGNYLYWEVAIRDAEGFVWKYHHIAKESIPAAIVEAYKTKAPVAAGTPIGTIVKWPTSSFGEVYHHLHMLVVAADGQYVNPFLMMTPLNDTQAPVISRIGLAQNHRPLEGNQIRGPHALFVEASDLIYHQRFILPPHKISYRLDRGAEKVLWTFVTLPSGRSDVDFIKDFYFTGTCGNYSCRKFYINLNFTQQNPRGQMTLTPGMHEVEVRVEDIVGNYAVKRFQWQVL